MIRILYEDNHLLVVEKPINIPVQGDESGDKDMLTLLKEDIKIRYNKPGNVYVGLVHRLDRPVGGAMVFAKTSKAASRLSDTLRKQEMEREYVAVVRGTPKVKRGKLEHYLWKDTKQNIVYATASSDKRAKRAALNYEVITSTGDLSLVRVQLETGRSHQIRVQFSEIGCPLYGDQKYGKNINKVGEQIALWSTKISFAHPTTKEVMSFVSEVPLKTPWQKFSV